MEKYRLEHELPEAIVEWGWRYHHPGIPTNKRMPGERYLPQFRFYISGFQTSPFGVEWMRFEEGSPMPELIQTVPHLAFGVDDLEYEIKTRNLKVLVASNSPMDGVRIAMIEHNGAPIELMEFRN